MRQNGTRVEVDTVHKRGSRAWVDYTVIVPAGTTVDVKSVSGDVQVSNVRGEVRAESVSGDVVASALPRVALLKSVSGDVQRDEQRLRGRGRAGQRQRRRHRAGLQEPQRRRRHGQRRCGR